ncbi:MAG: SCO family protein [Deltaproteobacteria bacterium]|nr:SCO family protein [Deltaproteobacteria bacterium]
MMGIVIGHRDRASGSVIGLGHRARASGSVVGLGLGLCACLAVSACGGDEPPRSMPRATLTAPPTMAPNAPPSAPAPAPAATTGHAVIGATAASAGSLFDLGLTLEDQAGATRELASWRGRPFILSMFYARCSYACPTLIQDLQRIEAALPDDVRASVQVLLVTFDPAGDTPAALSELAERHGVDAGRWTIARAADDERTRELAGALGIKYRRLPDGHYNHSTLITLVDGGGVPLARIDGLGQDATAFRAVVESVARPRP